MLRHSISIFMFGAIALSGTLTAQEFPTRPVRIVTAAVGGTTDLVARTIARGMTANLSQQVIVDNRPTGIVPGEIVVKASPDGELRIGCNRRGVAPRGGALQAHGASEHRPRAL
jgi:tripartite-type tricarboxylate transporter receptor subunit TctC